MPVRRIHSFHRNPRQTDQKPEERNTFWWKFAPHFPFFWLICALLWGCIFASCGADSNSEIILLLSLYFWFTSLVGFFVRCLAPPRVRDIPDLVLIVVAVLFIFFPLDPTFFGWNWMIFSLLLAAMTLENIVRAICGKERRRTAWKAVFAAMALISFFFLNYIGDSWASC